jgi:hypothetical protein
MNANVMLMKSHGRRKLRRLLRLLWDKAPQPSGPNWQPA